MVIYHGTIRKKSHRKLPSKSMYETHPQIPSPTPTFNRGTPKVTFLAPTPAKWKVFWAAGLLDGRVTLHERDPQCHTIRVWLVY